VDESFIWVIECLRGFLIAQALNVIHINTDLSLSTCFRKRGPGGSSTEGANALQARDAIRTEVLEVELEPVLGDASGMLQRNTTEMPIEREMYVRRVRPRYSQTSPSTLAFDILMNLGQLELSLAMSHSR
jgi:hypothetical protein